MLQRQRFLPFIVIACIYISFSRSPPACADGFRNTYHDAAAIAQGNAFAAQSDNASAVFYNPAAMAQLHGIHHAGGIQFVNINTTFTSPIGTTSTNSGPTIGLPPPGQFFLRPI